MNKEETKKMCISAECGKTHKRVTFPVPAEMVEWMNELSDRKANLEAEGIKDDALTFVVEGGRSMVIRISIFDFGERF